MSEKANKNYNKDSIYLLNSNSNNDDGVNYELKMEEEYVDADATPGEDPTNLSTTSDLIEVDVRTEEEYVELEEVTDEGPAIFLNPSELRFLSLSYPR